MKIPWWVGLAILGVLGACSGGGGGASGPVAIALQLGDPITGLPPAQVESFHRGREVLARRFGPSDGLGPFFNAVSCQSCHEIPVAGGSAPGYRNFFLVGVGPLGSQVGVFPLPSMVMPSYGPLTANRPTIPALGGTSVVAAHRNAPSMLGVGLFEFVSDATILAGADPDDADSDGISGRFNRDAFGNIGRFGYKCQANSLESFLRGAFLNQMGITTAPVLGSAAAVHASAGFLPQISTNPDFPTFDLDAIPDPELSVPELNDLLTFSRFLAPPTRRPMSAAAAAGEIVFQEVGCTGCHFPVLPSAVGPLEAYTDLLLHDMGPGLADGISMGMPQPSALIGSTTEQEFRTQPLWGVALHGPFLHDGRADTLEEAIILHGGEAGSARDAFVGRSPDDQANLIAFLESL